MSPFEILYETRPKDPLLRIVRKDQDLFSQDVEFLKTWRQIRINAIDLVKMTQVRMIILWNYKHRPSNFVRKVYIKIAKQGQLRYHIFESSSLTIKKLRLFSLRRKIENLVYELDLLNNIKIYSVISVIHLKQAKKNKFEKKDFATQTSRSIIINKKEQWVIDKIMKAEIRNKESEYWVK